jgi:tetratricopeptide (TPR) repeat protein
MKYYALFYFQKAAVLRPHDSRMWFALAQTYEALDRHHDAIRSYHRALGGRVPGIHADTHTSAASSLSNSGKDGNELKQFKLVSMQDTLSVQDATTLFRLAQMYVRINNDAKATLCFLAMVHYCDRADLQASNFAEALLFIANYQKLLGMFQHVYFRFTAWDNGRTSISARPAR